MIHVNFAVLGDDAFTMVSWFQRRFSECATLPSRGVVIDGCQYYPRSVKTSAALFISLRSLGKRTRPNLRFHHQTGTFQLSFINLIISDHTLRVSSNQYGL